MTALRYVRWGARRNSWHIAEDIRAAVVGLTLCGREPKGLLDLSDRLPAARSCESCLRLAQRRTDS